MALPKACHFGNVKCGGSYEMQIALTNVGIDATRFKVKIQSNSCLKVEHKTGLVAPGITVHLRVTLNTKTRSESLKINETIEVLTESDILYFDVEASK